MSSKITVTIKLYGVLRRYRPIDVSGAAHELFAVNLQNGVTVTDLTNELGIKPGSFNSIAVNGESASEDTLLRDGDEVRLFPPSAGG